MQASCFYVAARQAEAHERERQFREVAASRNVTRHHSVMSDE